MKARRMNDHNTPWRKEWRNLIKDGFIKEASSKSLSGSSENGGGNGIFTSRYELTEKGEDHCGCPRLRAMKLDIETKAKTSAEQHDKIRKLCMNNRAVDIFDLLLKHGSLTRRELAATVGISDRGAPFSYGLRQLKKLGYIVVDEKIAKRGKKSLMLSDKAFLDPKDRPEPVITDAETMSANIEKVYGKEMRKAADAKAGKKTVAVKKEIEAAIKTEETEGGNGGNGDGDGDGAANHLCDETKEDPEKGPTVRKIKAEKK